MKNVLERERELYNTCGIGKCYLNWGGSRAGSGGSVEPPKLNIKTYNKRVVKKSEPTQLINISFEN